MNLPLERLINLDRYPITRLDDKVGRRLVTECRTQMAALGACVLDDFVRAHVLKQMVANTESLVSLSHHNANCTTTPYQESINPDEESDHPRKSPRTTSVHVIAYDLIPQSAVIRQLYESEQLLAFIAAVLEVPILHRYADRLAGLNIAVNLAGDHNGWHFDQCDFVTSLLMREAEIGGQFEFVPNIRDSKAENYPSVRKVLNGECDRVLTLPMKAGSLSIFKGRHSIHRVTRIEGHAPRMIALLGYDTEAGVLMTESARMRRFGRVA